MIIGNNNIGKKNFISNNNLSQNKTNNNQHNTFNQKKNILNPMNENSSSFMHSNIMNKDEMKNKAFAMLQERLSSGTITIEEFNRKCHELGKQSK